jgi:hypothetical protein
MERGAGRLAGRKGRAEQAIGHFIEPMACLIGAGVPAVPEWEYETEVGRLSGDRIQDRQSRSSEVAQWKGSLASLPATGPRAQTAR